ncbi:YceI family protein [Dyella terrae]|uniref:YceI family protein n=1 Tax=Dyella terrae TaxID=522259 RepID=UPI001EFC57E1|nr:YceI family protein [Dyella terrae]ULU25523.1 YceI family protein [Dyella terrae]
MKRLRFIALAAWLLMAGAAHAMPVTYTVATKISRVSFTIEHQGFIQLFGTLRMAPGTFTFDEADWSKSQVNVTLPTSTLDMGDAHWNQQIRGDKEWMPLFSHPTITFRSTRLEKKDDTHGTLYGELTLGGVTRPMELPLQLNKVGINAVSEQPSVGFSAATTIKRSQFGIDGYSDLVGDDIKVQIQLEAAVGPDPGAPQAAHR